MAGCDVLANRWFCTFSHVSFVSWRDEDLRVVTIEMCKDPAMGFRLGVGVRVRLGLVWGKW